MTLCDCPRCGRRELRGARSLRTVPTARGDVFGVTCRGCGSVVSATARRLLEAAPMDEVA